MIYSVGVVDIKKVVHPHRLNHTIKKGVYSPLWCCLCGCKYVLSYIIHCHFSPIVCMPYTIVYINNIFIICHCDFFHTKNIICCFFVKVAVKSDCVFIMESIIKSFKKLGLCYIIPVRYIIRVKVYKGVGHKYLKCTVKYGGLEYFVGVFGGY